MLLDSDLCIEDLTGRKVGADTHELEEANRARYVLRHTPKDAEAAEFAYYRTWVLRASMLTSRAVYYDRSGRKVREYSVLRWRRSQGHPTVEAAEVRNHHTRSVTTLEWRDAKYDVGLTESDFAESSLRDPPGRLLIAR